jgi:hypothetical protein
METALEQNKKPQDIYGKVIDQDGTPVSGAIVEGKIMVYTGYMHSSYQKLSTETDADGRFSFIGIHGAKLGIWPKLDGYFYNLKQPSKRPDDYQPDPNNPVVFHMWKIHGAEPLVGKNIESSVPLDGTPATFDLATGKKSANGDVQITMTRFPLQRPPGLVHPYDWHVKIEMTGGGLMPESDAYQYRAPDTGYQPSWSFEMSSNNVPWKNQLEQDFYIQDSKGKYGHMHVDLTTTSKSAETGITIQTTLNPSGSKNLEPATAE